MPRDPLARLAAAWLNQNTEIRCEDVTARSDASRRDRGRWRVVSHAHLDHFDDRTVIEIARNKGWKDEVQP